MSDPAPLLRRSPPETHLGQYVLFVFVVPMRSVQHVSLSSCVHDTIARYFEPLDIVSLYIQPRYIQVFSGTLSFGECEISLTRKSGRRKRGSAWYRSGGTPKAGFGWCGSPRTRR